MLTCAFRSLFCNLFILFSMSQCTKSVADLAGRSIQSLTDTMGLVSVGVCYDPPGLIERAMGVADDAFGVPMKSSVVRVGIETVADCDASGSFVYEVAFHLRDRLERIRARLGLIVRPCRYCLLCHWCSPG